MVIVEHGNKVNFSNGKLSVLARYQVRYLQWCFRASLNFAKVGYNIPRAFASY
jgi:hypothetical protein